MVKTKQQIKDRIELLQMRTELAYDRAQDHDIASINETNEKNRKLHQGAATIEYNKSDTLDERIATLKWVLGESGADDAE